MPHLIALSLLACNPDARLEREFGSDDPTQLTQPISPDDRIAVRAAAPSTEAPARPRFDPGQVSGALIQRDCYGASDEEARFGVGRSGALPPSGAVGGLGSRGSGFGGGGSGAPTAKRRAPARPAAAAAPPPPPSAAPMPDSAAMAESAAPPPPEASRERKPAPPRRAEADAKSEGGRMPAQLAADADDAMAEPELGFAAQQRRPGPTLDWGATVYLSNDDSMSLASAQRLLWAVDQGRSFGPGEVRPHELLNYFSFDTAPVAAGRTFSVLGSAEQEDDTLRVALAVKGATPPRQPLDLSLVVDRSCSMNAEGRMDYTKRGLNRMTEQLVDGDRIDLVLFDSSICTPLEGFVVGRDDPQILTRAIAQMRPTGATDLDAGLREAYRIHTARPDEEVNRRNRRILLLTDAMLNSGNVDEALVSEIGRRFEDDGIRVTGVGVGRDFNDAMLDKITEKAKGAYVYLGSEAVVDRVFGSGFDALVQTIAHDVQFSIELPQSLAMQRFYGEESSTVAADVQPIHYYAGTSQLFLQDLTVREGGFRPGDLLTFRARFRDAVTGEPAEEVYRVELGALLGGETHNLHKARALMAWTDLLAARAMGDRSCEGLDAYRRAAARAPEDAEIGYVSKLTGKLCGVDMSAPLPPAGVRLKLKLDSDVAIDSAELRCGSQRDRQAIGASSNIVTFAEARPGTCELTLSANVPMRTTVEVPQASTDLRCLVRGGRVSCS